MENINVTGCPNFNGSTPALLSLAEKYVAVVLYSLVAVVAIGGNFFVIFVIFHFPRMRTVTNLFIANLAVSDILMAIMCIPFSYWPVLILANWPFGLIMCKSISFIKVLAVMLSAHTLVIISFDRFIAVTWPLRKPTTWRVALILLITIWTVDTSIAFPVVIVQSVQTQVSPIVENSTGPNLTFVYCSEEWNDELSNILYSTMIMMLQYFIPLVILVLTYISIGIKVWLAVTPGETDVKADRKRRNVKRKAIFMMFLVSTFFAICWLPVNALNVLVSKCISYLGHPWIRHIWWGCHFCAMCQSCVNPFIYIFASERFREGFQYVFQYCPCVKYEPKELLTLKQTRQATAFRSMTTRTTVTYSSATNGDRNSNFIKLKPEASTGYSAARPSIRSSCSLAPGPRSGSAEPRPGKKRVCFVEEI